MAGQQRVVGLRRRERPPRRARWVSRPYMCRTQGSRSHNERCPRRADRSAKSARLVSISTQRSATRWQRKVAHKTRVAQLLQRTPQEPSRR